MAEVKQEVIIDLKLDGFQDLEKLKVAIVQNKEEQKQLQAAYKQGQITVKEFASEQVRLEANLKKNQTEYRNTQQAVTGVKTKFDEQLKMFLCNEMGSNHSKKITLVFE
jgi:predicted nuclease with TOPRIM domain